MLGLFTAAQTTALLLILHLGYTWWFLILDFGRWYECYGIQMTVQRGIAFWILPDNLVFVLWLAKSSFGPKYQRVITFLRTSVLQILNLLSSSCFHILLYIYLFFFISPYPLSSSSLCRAFVTEMFATYCQLRERLARFAYWESNSRVLRHNVTKVH